MSLDLRLFWFVFFANFDHIIIVSLISDFTCFLLVLSISFLMGMGQGRSQERPDPLPIDMLF